jgi:hypothetical protein
MCCDLPSPPDSDKNFVLLVSIVIEPMLQQGNKTWSLVYYGGSSLMTSRLI